MPAFSKRIMPVEASLRPPWARPQRLKSEEASGEMPVFSKRIMHVEALLRPPRARPQRLKSEEASGEMPVSEPLRPSGFLGF